MNVWEGALCEKTQNRTNLEGVHLSLELAPFLQLFVVISQLKKQVVVKLLM